MREQNLNKFFEHFNNETLSILILGKRGSGKSALGFRLLEIAHGNTDRHMYTINFPKPESLPKWIENVTNIDSVKENSFLLIDEGGLLYSSRNSMKGENKLVSELLMIARHKNITTLFIVQNSGTIDLNIIRFADVVILKQPSLIQEYFERPFIKRMYQYVSPLFKPDYDNKPFFYLLSDVCEGMFKFILPKFWSTTLSKSFKDGVKDLIEEI